MISVANSKIFIPFLTTRKEKIERNLPPAVNTKLEFKKLFQTYYQPIFRLCLQVTRNYETAENMTIKVFVQFYKESNVLNKEGSLGEQLRRLTVSRLLNYQQQNQAAHE